MNEFLIGTNDHHIVFMRMVPMILTSEQAISLAAWLTVIADPTGKAVAAKVAEIIK